jgi:hypothetical protein
MSKTDLENLAALAAGLPAERRWQLEAGLPLGNRRFSEGVVEGLHLAWTLAAAHSEPAAHCIREVAAVAAAQFLENEKLYEYASRELDKPEVRAEIEALAARIEAGQEKMVRMEDVLRELEEIEARRNGTQGEQSPGGTTALTSRLDSMRGS